MLEIRICPETAIEFKVALQLVTTLASAEAEPEPPQPRAKPWERRATKPDSAPAAQPCAPAPAASVTETSDADDIPYPPFDDPQPSCSRQQVLNALQDYAQTNGAMALKEVLDRFGARRVSDIKAEHYPEVMIIARGELA